MKYLICIIMLYICYGNFSYQSLLLPNSTYDLISGYSQYSSFSQLLMNQKIKKSVSSSFLIFPQDIQITAIDYKTSFSNYYSKTSLNIIDYGEFIDSESNIKFKSKDIIFKNHLIMGLYNQLYGSLSLNYINSKISDYSSSALYTQASLFINHQNFIIETSLNNYGLIIKDYTSYNEILPTSFSITIIYLPKYLNSSLLIHHNSFDQYSITNVFGELFIKDNYSITTGYTSLAHQLYSEDFNNNFLTGFSFGFNFKYDNYIVNIGIKNLGSIGMMNAITLNKSFN